MREISFSCQPQIFYHPVVWGFCIIFFNLVSLSKVCTIFSRFFYVLVSSEKYSYFISTIDTIFIISQFLSKVIFIFCFRIYLERRCRFGHFSLKNFSFNTIPKLLAHKYHTGMTHWIFQIF